MKQKHFFKNQGSLQRKAIASGLTATFVFGTVGSGFAGAMEKLNVPQEPLGRICIKVEKSMLKTNKCFDFNDSGIELLEKIGDGLGMSQKTLINC